jgi:tetratricopeptide (TPR) repeat protein
MLESNRCEEAAIEARELRTVGLQDDAAEALRRLISARLALKKSPAKEGLEWLSLKSEQLPWIEPEAHFVVGLYRYHLGQFQQGGEYFRQAEEKFLALGFQARALLAALNLAVGQTYARTLSLSEEIIGLTDLERRAREAIEAGADDIQRIKRLLAMVLRQKAVAFEKEFRVHAALGELEKALDIFELHGPVSDYHLSLLHAADLCLDADNRVMANRYFERVLPPVDVRIEFPLAYLRWRLHGGTINPEEFDSVVPAWLERYERRKNQQQNQSVVRRVMVWNRAKGDLREVFTDRHWKIKTKSLEGRLLLLLCKGRASKNLLGEALWPEHSETAYLDHRLHQLISRVNRKYGELIEFDGTMYRLTCDVQIT